MITRLRLTLFLAFAAAGLACDQVPLLAPSGASVTLTSSHTSLGPNESAEIAATVIEDSGTPVHNGTLVLFTTTAGELDMREARTHGGVARVRLSSGSESGIATIRASSGGASSASGSSSSTDGGSTPTAAAALTIRLGAAAAEQVTLSAEPASVAATGGTVTILARVIDNNSRGLPGVTVSFSATAGSLSTSNALTDAAGVARVSLTTNADSDVTARVGLVTEAAAFTVTVRDLTGLTVTPPTTVPTAGETTELTVTAIGGNAIRNVVLNFGDGTTTSLGTVTATVTVPHVYQSPGTYTATATGTDLNGDTVSGATSVVVEPAEPLSVTLAVDPPQPTDDSPVTFTATVSPATAKIVRYDWSFGDGETATTNGNVIIHVYETFGRKDARVTVRDVNGNTASTRIQVQVEP